MLERLVPSPSRFVLLSVLWVACGTEPAPPQASGERAAAEPASGSTAPAGQSPVARDSERGEAGQGAGAEARETATVDPRARRQPSSPAAGESARYQPGIQANDFGYDLSKVEVKTASTPPARAADDAPASSGGLVQPSTTLKGRISMADGDSQVHDFGKLRQGLLGQHRFHFVSDGEEPLVINTIKPSCGCTKADIVLLAEDGTETPYTKGSEIPIGQPFALDAAITTDGKPAGPFSAQVALYGNDPRGAFTVRMTAQIEPVLEVKPSTTVYLGRMTTADEAEQTVTVRSVSGEPFLLRPNEKGIVEPLRVELTPVEPDAEGRAAEWRIHVALGPNIPVGMRYYPIVFKSDIPIPNPKYPPKEGEPAPTYVAQLNVQAQVVGMVHAEPNFVNFGIVRPGTPVERTLQLEVHDDFQLSPDMPIHVEGYQGQEFPFPDAFKTSVIPREDGKGATVSVRLEGLPEDYSGSFGGVLRIEVGHPHLKDLNVRFSGVARKDLTRRKP